MAATPVCASPFPPSSPSAAGDEQDSLCPLCAGQSRARDGGGGDGCPAALATLPTPHCLSSHKLAWRGQHGQLDGQ